MTIERRRGITLWRQIEQEISRDMREKRVLPGEKLPTEAELSARFGVNRHTVRRALQELENRGLVRVEQGRGSFMQEPVIGYLVGSRTRFSEVLSRQGRSPGGTVLSAREIRADSAVARALRMKSGQTVICIETVGEADGRRISYASHYFPKPRFDGMVNIFRETGSVTEALARFGIEDYSRKSTRVIARMPTAAEAHQLQQPKSRPLLVAEGVDVDQDAVPIQFGVTRFASDWVQIVFEP